MSNNLCSTLSDFLFTSTSNLFNNSYSTILSTTSLLCSRFLAFSSKKGVGGLFFSILFYIIFIILQKLTIIFYISNFYYKLKYLNFKGRCFWKHLNRKCFTLISLEISRYYHFTFDILLQNCWLLIILFSNIIYAFILFFVSFQLWTNRFFFVFLTDLFTYC